MFCFQFLSLNITYGVRWTPWGSVLPLTIKISETLTGNNAIGKRCPQLNKRRDPGLMGELDLNMTGFPYKSELESEIQKKKRTLSSKEAQGQISQKETSNTSIQKRT